jgi:hypothetical protein
MVCHQADESLEGSGDSSPRDMAKGLYTRQQGCFATFSSWSTLVRLIAFGIDYLNITVALLLWLIVRARSNDLTLFLYSQRLRSKAMSRKCSTCLLTDPRPTHGHSYAVRLNFLDNRQPGAVSFSLLASLPMVATSLKRRVPLL